MTHSVVADDRLQAMRDRQDRAAATAELGGDGGLDLLVGADIDAGGRFCARFSPYLADDGKWPTAREAQAKRERTVEEDDLRIDDERTGQRDE